MLDFQTDWGHDLEAIYCNNCEWSYLVEQSNEPDRCPHCLAQDLEVFQDREAIPPTPAPELMVPFTVTKEAVHQSILDFSNSFWFSPPDLIPSLLEARMQKVFLPMWLVDCDVVTPWQAEVGFDYKVVSHNERYHNGKWHTIEKQETKVRWEQRVGRVARHYDNVRAPALEDHEEIVNKLGRFKFWQLVPYHKKEIAGALVRMPNREADDAWPDTNPLFMKRVEKDCQKASDAQHIRQFKWQPEFKNHHWTKLMLPVLTTYYVDDKENLVPLLINGENGHIIGRKVASDKRARRISLILGAISALLFLSLILLLITNVQMATGLITISALLLAAAALFPIIYVSQFNRTQKNLYPTDGIFDFDDE